MVLAVQILEPLTRDMCVDLCGTQVAVTQQQLHYAQIRTAIQQVRGECVPQTVWRHLPADASFLGVSLDDVPERLAGHAITATRWKQVVRLALEQNLHARAVDEISEPALRFFAKRNQPLAIAFTDDTKNTLIEVDLRLLEIDQLGDS
jgi:hypothetical protein